MSRLKIRQRLANLWTRLNKSKSPSYSTEKEKGALLEGSAAVERLAEWCQLKSPSIPNEAVSTYFLRKTINETYKSLSEAGWSKDKIENMKITEILPLIVYRQGSILNELQIDDPALIPSRIMETYDLLIYKSTSTDPGNAADRLNEWWSDYYNLTLENIWSQRAA